MMSACVVTGGSLDLDGDLCWIYYSANYKRIVNVIMLRYFVHV